MVKSWSFMIRRGRRLSLIREAVDVFTSVTSLGLSINKKNSFRATFGTKQSIFSSAKRQFIKLHIHKWFVWREIKSHCDIASPAYRKFLLDTASS